MRREWIEINLGQAKRQAKGGSPSMRREWIEMTRSTRKSKCG